MPGPEEYDEFYTRNALETFKFGSPSITTMTDISSVDPLSSNEDFQPPMIDTTPRPSLAVHTDGAQFQLSQMTSLFDRVSTINRMDGARAQPLPMTSPSERAPTVNHRSMQSNATFHTFGSTSVSPSGSLLMHPDDRSRSRPNSSQERSSDDEPRVRYHRPPHVESLHSSSTDDASFRDEYYPDDDEEFSDFELSSSSHYDNGSAYSIPPHEEDISRMSYLSQRRGSNPIPIPGAHAGPSQGRDREDSVATVKFPTPSAPGPSTMGPASLINVAPNPLSLPANSADWDQRRRALHDRIESPTSTRSHPHTHTIDYPSPAGPSTAGPSTQPRNVDLTLDFDENEWQKYSRGIKNLNDFCDVNAATTQVANNQGGWWRPFGLNDDRRPSNASTINDTFQKHALAYKDQDWSFQRDKADDGAIPKPKKGNVFIPFSERPPKRGPPWRGMALGDAEFWRNELTGIYKVERLEVYGM
jgi:hypothetical protein